VRGKPNRKVLAELAAIPLRSFIEDDDADREQKGLPPLAYDETHNRWIPIDPTTPFEWTEDDSGKYRRIITGTGYNVPTNTNAMPDEMPGTQLLLC
jgi:hypothetical protein